jgi:hypothetical protein
MGRSIDLDDFSLRDLMRVAAPRKVLRYEKINAE